MEFEVKLSGTKKRAERNGGLGFGVKIRLAILSAIGPDTKGWDFGREREREGRGVGGEILASKVVESTTI